MNVQVIPRWLENAHQFAGALDHIDPQTGMRGWLISQNDFSRTFEVAVVSNGRQLAKGFTGVFRADLSEALEKKLYCGFLIRWSDFDASAISEVLAEDSEAAFEVIAPEILARLPKYSTEFPIEDVSLRACASHVSRNVISSAKPKTLSASIKTDRIRDAGLIDAGYYLENLILAGKSANCETVEHYLTVGEPDGIKPNPYFDPVWYSRKHFSALSPAGALAHYIEMGEREGFKPCPVFEPDWYAATYGVETGEGRALAHYLANRRSNDFNPNRFFDAKDYQASNEDIRQNGLDAFEHWRSWGVFEARGGVTRFNAEFVRKTYLGSDRSLNPFEIFMDVGQGFGWKPVPMGDGASVHRQVAASSSPGRWFEPDPGAAAEQTHAKAVALYLPQFHAIPENDCWWGPGFTEWRNLSRGLPRFEGHIQPRIPRDLGFYTLEDDSTLRRQIELARRAGVYGFCFYYYNFNGHRLLERPLETFLAQDDIDFPFCLMWANETWSRRWDGSEKEILIKQDHRPEDMPAMIDDVARHMKDPRYLRADDGRPLFFVYRADVIPDCGAAVESWRERFREIHGLSPLIVMAQTFGAEDPRPFGFDGAIEFPPHKLGAQLPTLNASVPLLDFDFGGTIRGYDAIVEESLTCDDPPFPLIKTAFPSWDNDSRRQGQGLIFANSTPQKFQDWMTELATRAAQRPFFGEPLVFVNAWNEWCEGAYLEPDTHFGYAYLNALTRALRLSDQPIRRILLVGHDAFPSGAQHLLYNIAAVLRGGFGLEVRIALIGKGELAERYRALAPTFIAEEHQNAWGALREYFVEAKREGYTHALINTAASGGAVDLLGDLGFSVVSLIHELPTMICASMLEPSYAQICARSTTVVYPSHYVKTRLDKSFGPATRPTLVRPQGLYHPPTIPPDARELVRRELNLSSTARIVLNLAYGDLRKGIDLFVALAEKTATLDPNIIFVWVGDVHPDLRPWLDLDLRERGLGNLRFLPFTREIGRYLGAADLFLLTSREDPFPSVVLEALAAGLPVAAFENTGGHVELIGADPDFGALLPFGAGDETVRRLIDLLDDTRTHAKSNTERRRAEIAQRFSFASYCADLVRFVAPAHRTVSVVVPSYNYARYIPERLESIFAQTWPVLEILVLDDASVDDSADVAEFTAGKGQRTVAVERRARNSGNVFRQWKAGLDRAQGEFLWIAEADDSATPTFLAEAIQRLGNDPQAAFAFSDSRAIDSEGEALYSSYKGYYREDGDAGLDSDGRFEGRDFLRRFLTLRNLVINASSVVWRRQALLAVFESLGEQIFTFRCAGDWRIYLEACRLGGVVYYIAAPLNIHRRHGDSVTQALDKSTHFKEIARVQDAALAASGADPYFAAAVSENRARVREEWGLDRPIKVHEPLEHPLRNF